MRGTGHQSTLQSTTPCLYLITVLRAAGAAAVVPSKAGVPSRRWASGSCSKSREGQQSPKSGLSATTRRPTIFLLATLSWRSQTRQKARGASWVSLRMDREARALSCCLPVCLSACLSVYLSVCLSVCLSSFLSFVISFALSLAISLSFLSFILPSQPNPAPHLREMRKYPTLLEEPRLHLGPPHTDEIRALAAEVHRELWWKLRGMVQHRDVPRGEPLSSITSINALFYAISTNAPSTTAFSSRSSGCCETSSSLA